MKVATRGGRVTAIAKTLPPAAADGENVGLVKFGPAGVRQLVPLLDQRVARGGLRDWAPAAFADFASLRPLHAVGTRGLPWIEIDFPDDYVHAVDHVLPAIEAWPATPAQLLLSPSTSAARGRRRTLGAPPDRSAALSAATD
jgi:choline kinase